MANNDDLLDDMEAAAPDEQEGELYLDTETENEVAGMYYSSLEANLALARLHAEGIPAFLSNNHSQSVLTHMQILVRLHVRPEDIATARLILADMGTTSHPTRRKGPEWGIWAAGAAVALALLATTLRAC